MVAGVKKRFATKPPRANRAEMRRFSRFVKSWLRKHLKPLDPTHDTSFETWLEMCPYPAFRKDELRKKRAEMGGIKERRHTRVKSFMKDETYPEYKHARAINSRTDEFKCISGPLFKAIEKELFKLPWFIKYVPVSERAEFISRLKVEGFRYGQTDFSSFESLFTRELMSAAEFQLYRYMFSNHPDKELMAYVIAVLSGTNHCSFKDFHVTVEATRMSGEMCTSLGNGFANLMILLYIAKRSGNSPEEFDVIVEGDDSIFRCLKPLNPQLFVDLGLIVKLEMYDDLLQASFCGLLYDHETNTIITEPLAELASIGWTKGCYANSGPRTLTTLLQSKGISLAYQYPNCPILASLAAMVLRTTNFLTVDRVAGRFLNSNNLNLWEREQLTEALSRFNGIVQLNVPMTARLLMEEKFGVSVDDQIRTEKYLDSITCLQPLEMPWLEDLVHPSWLHYSLNYVDNKMTDPLYPIMPLPRDLKQSRADLFATP